MAVGDNDWATSLMNKLLELLLLRLVVVAVVVATDGGVNDSTTVQRHDDDSAKNANTWMIWWRDDIMVLVLDGAVCGGYGRGGLGLCLCALNGRVAQWWWWWSWVVMVVVVFHRGLLLLLTRGCGNRSWRQASSKDPNKYGGKIARPHLPNVDKISTNNRPWPRLLGSIANLHDCSITTPSSSPHQLTALLPLG